MSNRSVTSIERTTNHEEKRMTDSGLIRPARFGGCAFSHAPVQRRAPQGTTYLTYGLRFMYAVACTESTRAARFPGVRFGPRTGLP